MADYQKMYRTLFRAATEAINVLQAAQVETERIYIEQDPDNITLLKQDSSDSDDDRDDNDCPFNGDIENDCADCFYSGEYHFHNGECIRRSDNEDA